VGVTLIDWARSDDAKTADSQTAEMRKHGFM
jgi:hypothetical protein